MSSDNFGGGLPDNFKYTYKDEAQKKDGKKAWQDFDGFLASKDVVCPFFYYSFTELAENGGSKIPDVSYHCFLREYERCDNNLYYDIEFTPDEIKKKSDEKKGRKEENIIGTCLGNYSKCEFLQKYIRSILGETSKLDLPFKKSENKDIIKYLGDESKNQLGKEALRGWYKKLENYCEKECKKVKKKVLLEAVGYYAYLLSKGKDHYCQCLNPENAKVEGFQKTNRDKKSNVYGNNNKRYCMEQLKEVMGEIAKLKKEIEKTNN